LITRCRSEKYRRDGDNCKRSPNTNIKFEFQISGPSRHDGYRHKEGYHFRLLLLLIGLVTDVCGRNPNPRALILGLFIRGFLGGYGLLCEVFGLLH